MIESVQARSPAARPIDAPWDGTSGENETYTVPGCPYIKVIAAAVWAAREELPRREAVSTSPLPESQAGR
jgi:hypothetical protein